MTQKLTLPIQVGKKYVNRTGKVIEIARISSNIANSSDGSNAVWAQTGTVGGYGSIVRNKDLVADYIEPAAAHPHAEAMMEYAKDAAELYEPWKNWEIRYNKREGTDWHNCIDHPTWNIDYQYRRKQPKVTINGIECVAGVKEPVFDELYYVASITQAVFYVKVRYTGTYQLYAKHGLVHHTEEDAIAMAKAMLNFQ